MLLRSQARAAAYHAKASDAAALAASSALQRVRELHELAAFKWKQLADLEDRRTESLARRFDRAAQAGGRMTPVVLDEEVGMYRLEVPAGSKIRLSATAGQVRRWDVRMFAAGEPSPNSTPRVAYGSQIGGADGDQRIEIPPQDVDCRLEADASRRIDGVWEADQTLVTHDTPSLLELGFGASVASVGDDGSTQLSFHFYAARPS